MTIDLLPPDEQLELMKKHKQFKLSLPQQKQLVQLVLDSLQKSQPLTSQDLLKCKSSLTDTPIEGT
jgi:hypothetical protein